MSNEVNKSVTLLHWLPPTLGRQMTGGAVKRVIPPTQEAPEPEKDPDEGPKDLNGAV